MYLLFSGPHGPYPSSQSSEKQPPTLERYCPCKRKGPSPILVRGSLSPGFLSSWGHLRITLMVSRVGALLSDVPNEEGGGTQCPICLACSWALLPAHTAVAGQPPSTWLLGPAATPSSMPG